MYRKKESKASESSGTCIERPYNNQPKGGPFLRHVDSHWGFKLIISNIVEHLEIYYIVVYFKDLKIGLSLAVGLSIQAYRMYKQSTVVNTMEHKKKETHNYML